MLLPWNCEFWFEVTGNKIWSNFRFIYSLFRENIETKFAGKKESFKTLLLYFVSFSVILSFLSVSLKVRRVKRFFKMFFSKIFPCFLTFRCFLRILLHICRLYLNSLDEAAQFMIIKAGEALVPLFPLSCSSLGRGWKPNPRSKIGTYLSNSDIYHLYLKLLCEY